MAKMGRPKSDAPKLNTLSLRVTDSELRELKDYADSHGMTITQLLHTGVDYCLRHRMRRCKISFLEERSRDGKSKKR